MTSYYDHMNRTQVTKAQRDQLWRDLKSAERNEPRPLDVVDAKDMPPMSDPTVTATRAALDANALGMTVEEVALPDEMGDADLVMCTDGVERGPMDTLPDWRDHEPSVAWETAK